MTFRDHLESIGACNEALNWAGNRTASEAWQQCPRAWWLLWWAARTPVNDKELIVRYAIKWRASSAGEPESIGIKELPEFDWAYVSRIPGLIAGIHDVTVRLQQDRIALTKADLWDCYMRETAALWERPALDAWVLALRTKGPDYCTQVRAAFRQPWKETT